MGEDATPARFLPVPWLTQPPQRLLKLLRDDGGLMSDERREALAGELGDVLWYVAQVATEAGLDLQEIAQGNLDKLLSRQRRGVLSGSGDSR